MSTLKEIKLSDAPCEALLQIAEHIGKPPKFSEHVYPDGADKREFIGFWQPVEYYRKLQNIAYEARRVAGQGSK